MSSVTLCLSDLHFWVEVDLWILIGDSFCCTDHGSDFYSYVIWAGTKSTIFFPFYSSVAGIAVI